MNYERLIEELLTKIQSQLGNERFREKYLPEGKNCFTRERKLSFEKLVAFLIERSAKPYNLKISDWIETKKFTEGLEPTKQAISKARQYISPELFNDFLLESAEFFHKEILKKKTWNGFQIYAIDGSDLQIPTTQETLEEFGAVKTRFNNRLAGASSASLYNVTNDVILNSTIKPYKTAERTMAKELIDSVLNIIEPEKAIFVFDRGYPSYEFIEYLTENKLNYVIRVKKIMSRLVDYEKADSKVYRKCGKKCREIRTIHFPLSEVENEYLITNLPKEKVEYSQFKELYFIRWGIEGKYRELKSQLKLENFSGSKVICIKQDFYISMFLTNICAFLKQKIDQEINEITTKSLKEYQANRSFLISQVNQYIGMILMKLVDVAQICSTIIERCKKKRSQIRRNRTCERKLNPNRRKHCMNRKSCF